MRSKLLVPVAIAGLMATAMSTGVAAQSSGGWDAFLAGLDGKYEGKTLHVITISDPFVPALQEVNQAFADLTGAQIVVDAFGYDAVYQKEQLACQQGSNAYDVIVFDIPWTQAFVDCTEHLNDRIANGDAEVLAYEDYLPVMQEAVSWDGEIIGLPFAPYFVLQHYNTEYFDTLGLTPATNFSEMLENAKTANQNPHCRTSTAPS